MLGVGAHELAVGGDELERGHRVGLQAVLARQPAHAAAERVAGDADVGRGAVQRRPGRARRAAGRRAPTWRRRRRARAGRPGRRGPPGARLTFSSSVSSRPPSGALVVGGRLRRDAQARGARRRRRPRRRRRRRRGRRPPPGCWSSSRLKAERASSQPGSPGSTTGGSEGQRRGEHGPMVRISRRAVDPANAGDRAPPSPSFEGDAAGHPARCRASRIAAPAACRNVAPCHRATSRAPRDGSSRSPSSGCRPSV